MWMHEELQQDPFDADEFVERLAWRTCGGVNKTNVDAFDPMMLHEAFENTIKDLKDMNVSVQRTVDDLEKEMKNEEKVHWQKVSGLMKNNQRAFDKFQKLDEKINFVATKVVHVGDQLEGVNTPRARAAEALMLMKYFDEFMDETPLKSQVLTDRSQVELAADIVQKLYLISQEIPSGPRFDKARLKIEAKYDEVEQKLIEDFKAAHHASDKRKMKRLAGVLSQFKCYNQCIDVFIEQCQMGAFQRDPFEDIPPLVARTNILINEVFTNPEMVLGKFILNIYTSKLQEHISRILVDNTDLEKYLQNLFTLYTRTTRLSSQLSNYSLGNDATFLNKVTQNIFAKYLRTYIDVETRFLREKSSAILHRYYDSKSHQKKNVQLGGIYEFRRDLQNVIGTKANINLGPAIENYGGETFLSQEVAINLLQESKLAFRRCQVLSSRADLHSNAARIFDALVQHLCVDHIDYALELGLQAIPLPDPKTQPECYYFDVVGQANVIFHLFEKQFSDNLIPLVSSSPKHSECLQKKREIMESMENKLDLGLDRTISAIVGWVRFILTTEQRKSDFKPDDENAMLQMYTNACNKVVKFINRQVETLRNGLDGKNVEAVLTELGIRFHRAVFDHLQQFQYNSMGAMSAICDVNEYRKCVKEFNIPTVSQLFDTLHSLCNLLVVVPDNLKHACTGEQLNGLDKTLLLSFVQLRSDYKTSRLAAHFK